MSKHTPEPWKIANGRKTDLYMGWDTIIGISEDGDKFVLCRVNANYEELGKTNARRIVACVNACAGIETDTLESEGSIAEIIASKRTRIAELEAELAAERAKVEQLRGVLDIAREAMSERRSYADMWEYKYGDTWDEEDQLIDDALAATEPGRG